MPGRLERVISPYLQLHADDPVDWWPWGEEAFERARDEGRPVLLSVGYFSCHWCHRMHRESFSDEETGQLLNERFVSVLVDREERPDIDLVYQEAIQILEDEVGWPLNLFLSPDRVPLSGGIYFPPKEDNGRQDSTFPDVLRDVSEAWQREPGELTRRGEEALERIREILDPPASSDDIDEIGEDLLRAALAQLEEDFDEEHAGFGEQPMGAPKLPHPATLDLLLRLAEDGHDSAIEMVRRSLDAMAEGAIFDHLGGGFHRYAADRRWRRPHFEKMLYDNGQLVGIYARAWRRFGDDRHRTVAEMTGDWILRELRDPEGGLWSSLDADTEGEEGAFYRWSREEVEEAAGADADAAISAWGLGEDDRPGGSVPAWTGEAHDEEALERARKALLDARSQRERPAADTKILCGWNALAAAGLAEAGAALDRPGWVDEAAGIVEFLLATHRADGRLMRVSRSKDSGERELARPAFCDDHAHLLRACMRLHEATGNREWLVHAQWLADESLRLFRDEDGGFCLSADDDDTPLLRPRDLSDVDIPSANSVLAFELQGLGELGEEAGYRDQAAGAMRLVGPDMAGSPKRYATLLAAVHRRLRGR